MADPSEESHAERLDRELLEFLNEIRVLLPGVQVLFAFLLAVPFATGFERVTDFQRDVYAVALLGALAANVFLVAPTTYHRIRWRKGDKEAIMRTSNALAIAGAVFLSISMTASVYLVGDYLYEAWLAWLASAVTALTIGTVWFGLPLVRRATADR